MADFPPYLEAQYESGFILREDEQDHSPYDSGRNIFHAILNKRPETAHGPMVRLALVTPKLTYTVDWTQLPDNARPIRFKHMERDFVGSEPVGPPRIAEINFGFQYIDENGDNVQEVKYLPAASWSLSGGNDDL